MHITVVENWAFRELPSKTLFKLLTGFIPLTYLVLNGHFGNNNALQMVRKINLHIISKLRSDLEFIIIYTLKGFTRNAQI
ncbi:transposase [Nostoc sp.]|uniref:transposase n=1 Tax=Nostoc sp. TaxID=1180 RepID=UPI003FA56541